MIQIHYVNNGRYCSSKDLHQVLKLNPAHYTRDVKKWLTSTYPFQGKKELTKPVANYDYRLLAEQSHSPLMMSVDNQTFNRLTKESKFSGEFMIRLELVKLVTLYGKSKVRDQFVRWLLSLDEMVESHELISPDLLFGLLELAKLCTYIDRQLQYYNDHKKTWQELIEDNRFHEFDVWRNKVLDIPNANTIKTKYREMVRIGNLVSKREQESSIDPYKSIRNAIFDFIKVQYQQIDYYFPESTEKALTLANMTQRILKLAGGTPDIKPRGYEVTNQLEIGKDRIEEEPRIETVSRLITKNIIASIN